MTAKWNIGLSLAAGLVGGAITHWAFPPAAWAQAKPPAAIQTPPFAQDKPAAAIQAQRFELVDPLGRVVATFSGARGRSQADVTLTTPDGKVIWEAPETAQIHPLVNK